MTAYDASSSLTVSITTDSTGHYTLSGLASGNYKVGFRACGGGNYLPQFYNGKSSLAAADVVSVTAGDTTSGIDAALPPGGQITGTATDAGRGTPVANECVSVYDSGGNQVGFALTSPSGQYTVSGLATGNYKVGFQSCGGGGNYVPQFYNNKSSLAAADVVSVTAGDTTSGIDAALQPAGQITGTVTDAATGAAVANECVGVSDLSGNSAGFGFTDSAGRYTVSGLASGNYKVGFVSCGGGNYLPQFYNGKSSLAAADVVSASAGSTTSGIDAALQQGGQITGTVTNAATGAAVANECVTVYDASNTFAVSTSTDSAGHYTLPGLATGNYKVGFVSCGGTSYLSQFYNGKSSLATADAVSVSAGSTTSGIDAALQPGGQITGSVTDAATGAAVANECVTVYDASSSFSITTDSAGHYTLSGLATGNYTVSFQSCGGGNYLPQFYNGKGSLATADVVSVSVGSTTSGIDAALQPAGQITGSVTDAATGAAVANECVTVYDASNTFAVSTTTDSAGHYTLSGLGTGNYKVGFVSCDGTTICRSSTTASARWRPPTSCR